MSLPILGGPEVSKASNADALHQEFQKKLSPWKMFKNNDHSLALPSPQPHTADEDEFPLTASAVRSVRDPANQADKDVSGSKWTEQLMFWKKKEGDDAKEDYPQAINKELIEDKEQDEARWSKFIESKDRETMRLPVINQTWFPSIPFVGKKVSIPPQFLSHNSTSYWGCS